MLLPQPGDKMPEDVSRYLLECLLGYMVTQVIDTNLTFLQFISLEFSKVCLLWKCGVAQYQLQRTIGTGFYCALFAC